MNFSAGRQGDLQGIFSAPKEHVEALVKGGLEIYFGEVLGKHSEICGPVTKDEIKMLTDDQEFIKTFDSLDMATGYNPFTYSCYGDAECRTVGEVVESFLKLGESAVQ